MPSMPMAASMVSCELLHVSATAPDTTRTLSSAVPTTMHRPIVLRAYQTERGLCCMYHCESGRRGRYGNARRQLQGSERRAGGEVVLYDLATRRAPHTLVAQDVGEC